MQVILTRLSALPRFVAAFGVAIALTVALPACGGDESNGGDANTDSDGLRPDDKCAGVVCEALSQCYEVGTCDPVTGLCSTPRKRNGARCDDGNACTYGDVCDDGECKAGGDVACRATSLCQRDGICDPAVGCVFTNAPDGTRCGDNDACTTGDQCVAGECVGTPKDCTAPNECYEVGACNPANGQCTFVKKPNGTACGGGSTGCSVDTCQEGACVETPKVCTPLSDCHVAGVCNPSTGLCTNPLKPNGSACDDGNACTTGTSCTAGTCGGGAPRVCTALSQCHDPGTCDPATGCSNPPKANGTACNDGNACTTVDSCQSGACTGASPIVCTAISGCHVPGVCDPASGTCSTPFRQNGFPCDDSNACTEGSFCTNGACGGGAAIACVPPDQCQQVGACDPDNGCVFVNKPNGTACNDADLCTQVDTCQAGACVGTSPVVCTALDQCFDVGTCDPTTGQCTNPLKADGSTCDDANLCTRVDACQQGACVGSAPVTCASEQCLTSASCDAGTGLCAGTPRPDGTACNDFDGCTQASSCQAGECIGSNPRVCSALDACHDPGICDPATGDCTNPLDSAATFCQDGLCFADVTSVSGIDYRNAGSGLSQMGGGVAWLDYDGDGDLDLMFAGEVGAPRLYRNNADGTFFDVTAASGFPTGLPTNYLMGAVTADYDNDGDTDVLLIGRGGDPLFRNNGDGTFTDINTTAGIGDTAWTTAAAWGDYDHDGDLDLYLGNYIAQANFPNHVPAPNKLYRNNGNQTFTDVTTLFGVAGAGTTLAVAWTDVDADGWEDLVVCNDFGAFVQKNQVYLNKGATAVTSSGWFVESSASLGADLGIYCMSIAPGDYDRDGDLDYYFSNLGKNALLSRGTTTFTDVTDTTGTGLERDACFTSLYTTSWSAGFHDFDMDGWLDLYVANGHVPGSGMVANSLYSQNTLFKGGSGLTFADISSSAGVGDTRRGRGAAFADFDGDGDIDIAQSNVNGSAILYRNEAPSSARWIQIELLGRVSNRDGFGARVTAALAGPVTLVREVASQYGYQASSQKAAHFGVGNLDEAQSVSVRWPSGITQSVYHVPRDTYVDLVEPYVTTSAVTGPAGAVAEGSDLSVSLTLVNATSQPRLVTYDAVVLSGGIVAFSGPSAQTTVPASGSAPVTIDITVPSGAAGGSASPVEILVRVSDAGGGTDQALVAGTIEP